jgi:hypothetical protein
MENNLLDTSGNGNDGTVGAGSAAYMRGKVGQAADFNPSGFMYADTPVTISAEWSIAFWVYVKSTVNGYFVNQWESGHPARFIIGEDGGNIFMFAGADVYRAAAVNETWIHLALSRNSIGKYVAYKDGSQVGTLTNSNALPAIVAQIGGTNRIGDRNSNSIIDDVQIWNRALQPHHIRAIYNGVDPAFIGDIA